jgi:septal ring factor EnvC (AmiA/AmiB activator)
MIRLLLSLALVLALAPAAKADPASLARAAADQLEEATLALQEARSARDRVRALTRTVQAYEAGLGAMRDGLRQAALREGQLRRSLEVREAEIADLLGVLQTIGAAPAPVLMLHPNGPQGSARAGMMLASVTPALNARVTELRADLEEAETLRLLQQSAVSTLEEGLAGVQQARAELSQALADRTDLPKRFTEDPVRTAILISSTETLEGFASGLSEITDEDIPPTAADITERKGAVPLPAQGVVLRRAGQPDSAGITRPGILLATRPRALVTTPTPATIRYRGPLLDLGNVVILEPQNDMLFVLSGLEEVYGETGEVLPEGSPVGLMGGAELEMGTFLSTSSEGTGTDRSETLYIEVREGGAPVDPEKWFRTDKDG